MLSLGKSLNSTPMKREPRFNRRGMGNRSSVGFFKFRDELPLFRFAKQNGEKLKECKV